ncbi:30S ribosomal protein S8 [Candidatus Pacearchaeota archaeon CG10_big_fil_rev_8_21_14_0_10_35_219]|nr:30S ribosomal protein S8 [Candidatus Pacearchaeota archaeon]OIO42308.1 MAG: 30S ribosomal protein S8 [Candidatus Pacearchaeota archaeon CG1_02_35_32]PIO07459.1 MAG: 30S ribosomal protein S8 [Candidatus Pacearchaeota archaeon CG10_big_fil_rev_8_21_14_0_10_35_219]PIY81265.1 MAG: 30S ribosomal protein S8 [Candidatus Pacearchaeota archaeon CG_4_10_14_0_8_um_filter_35_169]PIZ80194.1 MAG: 30S ribosomal protein S8 [Candidatus Pacearchaeota archaeon CG_4_10_14_0_2_um_filter_35_33]PJA69541.1 MAG: 30
MAQDIVSDALNQMMNAKKAGKESVELKRHSKVLLSILAIGKLRGYIKGYSVKDNSVSVEFGRLNFCKSVKPRYLVKARDIEKYVRRYLPARGMGVILVSTSQGLMTHQTAQEKNLGGSIIAYFY